MTKNNEIIISSERAVSTIRFSINEDTLASSISQKKVIVLRAKKIRDSNNCILRYVTTTHSNLNI